MGKTRLRILVRILFLTVLVVAAVYFYFDGLPLFTAPYPLTGQPIVAMRIVGNDMDARAFLIDPNTIHGYAIMQTATIHDPALQRDIVSALDSRFSYGGNGARCFEPGIAIKFGNGQDSVDALICISCGYVYFFHHDQGSRLTLSQIGINRIKAIYGRMFAGHYVDVEDADAKKMAEWRYNEFDRRMYPTSAPANTP